MKIQEDRLIFDNGNVIGSTSILIGLSKNMDVMTSYNNLMDELELTLPEQYELADYMISLWQSYKKHL